MVTVFSIPKAFEGHIGRIQQNAIDSWTAYFSDCEILLCGDDPGVEEVAADIGGRHIPDITTNESGTPLVSSLFRTAQEEASSDLLLYINADIIFVDDLPRLISELHSRCGDGFLAVGERWNLEISTRLDFSEARRVRKQLLTKCRNRQTCGPSAIDYFGFRRGAYTEVPDFAIGRMGWDNWLLAEAKRRAVPIVDLTPEVTAIHQEHGRPDVEDEINENLSLVEELGGLYTLRSADWVWTGTGMRRPQLVRRLLGRFNQSWLGRKLLTLKRSASVFGGA